MLDVRPLDAGPLEHLAAAVHGHAGIIAAIADHAARQYAGHPPAAGG